MVRGFRTMSPFPVDVGLSPFPGSGGEEGTLVDGTAIIRKRGLTIVTLPQPANVDFYTGEYLILTLLRPLR